LASKEARIKELDLLMETPDFWLNNEQAQQTIAERNRLRAWVVPYGAIVRQFSDVSQLLPEAIDSGEETLVKELLAELDKVEKNLEDLEVRKMLSGELDVKNCYLSINAGAGGTEACDWVQMLSRMYQRWVTKRNWQLEVVDVLDGEVAGLKHITFKIVGDFAYGYAKAEKGVHRLVRISPFDSNAKRHTSFASVDVTPEITDEIVVDLKPEDIRVDTFRSSGAGGQHVNKTDSAVRMTHMPTGIVVSSQSQRSQVQNRETCLQMLRSKLYEMKLEERKKTLQSIGGEKKEIGWGNQTRNYVFQPYTLVKDTRTKFESGNINSVMDGEIDDFIIAYLKEFG